MPTCPIAFAPTRSCSRTRTTRLSTTRNDRIAWQQRVQTKGTDGKLVHDKNGDILHVTLLEKLIVPALSKLSNLVPDGGIWMNTQRPEWNDANNALAGNGLSMVTLYYLRRYLAYLRDRLALHGTEIARLSTGVATWMRDIHQVFSSHRADLKGDRLTDATRKQILDALGGAFQGYRLEAYRRGLPGTVAVPVTEVSALCTTALAFLDHAIQANRREDGLYHAYNILEITGEGAAVHPLYEMLEGQVAVLSSGSLGARETLHVLESLFASPMYQADRKSFLLYPARELPGFLERNRVSADAVERTPLLKSLMDAGETRILVRDADGVYRFHPDFHNARDLTAALDALESRDDWAKPVREGRAAVLSIFEEVFHHRAFTGRSGTMYGYEGLGCVYWHMVAKLLLAVQEIIFRSESDDTDQDTVSALIEQYFRIRAGLGFEKTVAEYGAFPSDPYSHTPSHAGAQQPGMTGQVKEEILTRFGELGVRIEDGAVSFRPSLLRTAEFLQEPRVFHYVDQGGATQSLDLPAGSLAFTFCQVPVVYTLGSNPQILVTRNEGTESIPGDRLEPQPARDLLSRSGRIHRLDVVVPRDVLLS